MRDFLIDHHYPSSRLGVEIRRFPPSQRPEIWLMREVVNDLDYYRDDIIALQTKGIISGVQNVWMVDRNVMIDQIDWGGIGMIQPIDPSLVMIPIRQEFIPGDADLWEQWRESQESRGGRLLNEFEQEKPSDGSSPVLISETRFDTLPVGESGDRVKIWDWKTDVRDQKDSPYWKERAELGTFSIREIVEGVIDNYLENIFEGLIEYESGNPTYFH